MNLFRNVCAAALLSACLTALIVPSGNMLNGDWYAYAEAGQALLDGGKLYREAWQDKPPVALLFYAVPQLFARGSATAIYVAFALWTALQIAAVWLLTRDLADPVGKWAASFLLCLLPLTDRDFAWPGTEQIANLFVTLNLLLGLRFLRRGVAEFSWCVVAGASIVLAFHARQSAMPVAATVGLAALGAGSTWPARRSSIAGIALGIGMGFAAIVGLTAWFGDLGGYWDVTFRYPGRYARLAHSAASHPGAAWAQVGWLCTCSAGALVTLPIFFVTAALAYTGPRRRGDGAWLLAVASLLTIIAVVSPMKPYVHYLSAWFPVFAALPPAYLADRAGETYRLKQWATVGLVAFVMLRAVGATALLVVAPEVDAPKQLRPVTIASVRQAAAYIDEHAAAGDDLFVYADWVSEPALYFATRTPPSHKYFWTLQMNPYWVDAIPDAQTIDAYRSRPPRWLATLSAIPTYDREHHPAGRRLTEHYLKTFAYEKMMQFDKWEIYRRSDSGDASAR